MLKIFTNALSVLQDRAIEASAKSLINQKIEGIGRVTEIQIDSKQKTISAQVALKGETVPISINIGAYELVQENGVTCISFKGFTASREWISALLNRYLTGHKLQVPNAVGMAL
jgi:uncharacterized Fe-S cluster-containing MiaB family protein